MLKFWLGCDESTVISSVVVIVPEKKKHRCYSVDNGMPYKSYDHMCNNTLARLRNVIDNVRVNNAFP